LRVGTYGQRLCGPCAHKRPWLRMRQLPCQYAYRQTRIRADTPTNTAPLLALYCHPNDPVAGTVLLPVFPYNLRQLYNSYTFRSRHTFGSDFNYALLRDILVTPCTRLPVSTTISAMFTISAISAISAAISAISVIFAIPETSAITPRAPVDLYTSPLYFLTFFPYTTS